MDKISKLDVFFSAQSFHEDELRNKTVVIIDVLRASSTIITALKNGVKGIIPVDDMAEASKIAQSVDSDNYLLCGEKDGEKIQGYDLGNSPLEYTAEVIGGKTLIFKTTNGTKAIKKSVNAGNIFVAGFLNVSTVVKELHKLSKDIVLVCAGWQGRLALEDMLLAGKIIHDLVDGNLPEDALDGAKISFGLYEKFGHDIQATVLNSNHAVRLKEIVGNEDTMYCCQIDITEVLPELKDGIITNSYGK
ncbi:MAG: 2-phosphosulfolactate phosphatase [Balneolaceae bacterium]